MTIDGWIKESVATYTYLDKKKVLPMTSCDWTSRKVEEDSQARGLLQVPGWIVFVLDEPWETPGGSNYFRKTMQAHLPAVICCLADS